MGYLSETCNDPRVECCLLALVCSLPPLVRGERYHLRFHLTLLIPLPAVPRNNQAVQSSKAKIFFFLRLVFYGFRNSNLMRCRYCHCTTRRTSRPSRPLAPWRREAPFIHRLPPRVFYHRPHRCCLDSRHHAKTGSNRLISHELTLLYITVYHLTLHEMLHRL